MANEGFGGAQRLQVPKGAKEVAVRIPQSPVLGPLPQQLGGASIPGASGPGMTPAQPQQAQVSPVQTPRGAQQVPLAVSPQASQQASPSLGACSTPSPQPRSIFGSPKAPAGPSGMDMHWIRVEGVGPDGTTRYVADVDVFFPAGTKILGVRKIEPGE